MSFKTSIVFYSFVFIALLSAGCVETEQLRLENLSMSQSFRELQEERDALTSEIALNEREKARLAEEQNKLENARREMEEKLQGTGATIRIKEGMISITLPSSVFFNSGQITLKKEAKGSLTTICNVLKRDFPDETIRIEGHTDNEPVKRTKGLYSSNWELSAIRAANVLHFLVDKCDLNPEKLFIAGYGEYQPVAGNKTESDKKKNRRVEIVVLTD